MGYMRHHAIVVTGSYDDYLEKAHYKATTLFGEAVSEIVPSPINHYRSFFVAPDGSKEGWPQSDDGDEARAKLLAFLESLLYEDNSSPLDWAEIQYGDDDHESLVAAHSDQYAAVDTQSDTLTTKRSDTPRTPRTD